MNLLNLPIRPEPFTPPTPADNRRRILAERVSAIARKHRVAVHDLLRSSATQAMRARAELTDALTEDGWSDDGIERYFGMTSGAVVAARLWAEAQERDGTRPEAVQAPPKAAPAPPRTPISPEAAARAREALGKLEARRKRHGLSEVEKARVEALTARLAGAGPALHVVPEPTRDVVKVRAKKAKALKKADAPKPEIVVQRCVHLGCDKVAASGMLCARHGQLRRKAFVESAPETPAGMLCATSATPPKLGFAAMTPERRRELARKGAAATIASGKGHRFTREEALAGNRKAAENRRAAEGSALPEAK